MDKQKKIIILSTIAIGGVSFLIYNSWKKNILYDDVVARIGLSNASLRDSIIWDSNFLTKVAKTNRNYSELGQSKLKEISEQVNNYIDRTFTNEDGLFTIFESLKSKVEVAQIKNFYFAKYNKGLLSELENALYTSEEKRIAQILNKMPDVIFLS